MNPVLMLNIEYEHCISFGWWKIASFASYGLILGGVSVHNSLELILS